MEVAANRVLNTYTLEIRGDLSHGMIAEPWGVKSMNLSFGVWSDKAHAADCD